LIEPGIPFILQPRTILVAAMNGPPRGLLQSAGRFGGGIMVPSGGLRIGVNQRFWVALKGKRSTLNCRPIVATFGSFAQAGALGVVERRPVFEAGSRI
jgi:hypothetical protein